MNELFWSRPLSWFIPFEKRCHTKKVCRPQHAYRLGGLLPAFTWFSNMAFCASGFDREMWFYFGSWINTKLPNDLLRLTHRLSLSKVNFPCALHLFRSDPMTSFLLFFFFSCVHKSITREYLRSICANRAEVESNIQSAYYDSHVNCRMLQNS